MLDSHSIHQIQVRYFPAEDRLLFRLNTLAQDDYRFWLTRRYSKQLWEALRTVFDATPVSMPSSVHTETPHFNDAAVMPMSLSSDKSPETPPIRAEHQPQTHAGRRTEHLLRAFEHEKITAHTDFQAEYVETETTQYPLGREPVLATRLKLQAEETGDYILCIHPREGSGIELRLDTRLTHLLCQLLMQGLDSTDWDLSCELPRLSQPMQAAQALH